MEKEFNLKKHNGMMRGRNTEHSSVGCNSQPSQEKEFNLSEKAFGKGDWIAEPEGYIPTEDVKEFIKKLKSKGNYCPCKECKSWREEIDKLAGEKLK